MAKKSCNVLYFLVVYEITPELGYRFLLYTQALDMSYSIIWLVLY